MPNPSKRGIDDIITATGATAADVAAFPRVRLNGGSDDREPPPPAEAPPLAGRYTFTPAFPGDHFVSQFVRYASLRSDGAHEFFEAAALTVLATVAAGVRVETAQHVDGVNSGLYLLLLGPSTTSRKSTALRYAKDLLQGATPQALLPERMSPESFMEEMEGRNGINACWTIDEFGDELGRLHHTAYLRGMTGHLLSFYDGESEEAARRSKRDKKTGAMQDDRDRVVRPCLTILGCSTPAILDTLTAADVRTGLMIRFGIVWPTAKPRAAIQVP